MFYDQYPYKAGCNVCLPLQFEYMNIGTILVTYRWPPWEHLVLRGFRPDHKHLATAIHIQVSGQLPLRRSWNQGVEDLRLHVGHLLRPLRTTVGLLQVHHRHLVGVVRQHDVRPSEEC